MLSTGYLRQLLSEAINDASIILGIEEKAKEQRFITNEIVQSGGHPLFSGCTDIYKYSEMIKVYASEKFNDTTYHKLLQDINDFNDELAREKIFRENKWTNWYFHDYSEIEKIELNK